MHYKTNKEQKQNPHIQLAATMLCDSSLAIILLKRSSQDLGEMGERAFISREQRPHFEGNRERKVILGNREHTKTNFRFLENREQDNLFLENKRTGTPPGGPC